jgi:hypothetical protein
LAQQLVDDECHHQHLHKDKGDIPDQIEKDVMSIPKDGVMDEVKKRRESH